MVHLKVLLADNLRLTVRYPDGAAHFKFENIPMKDGSSICGDVLYVNNFYGDIELSFDGDMV